MPKRPNAERFEWMLAGTLDLPKEIVLDLPNLTIVGQRELYLENHRGIVEYSPGRVRINLSRGHLDLEGENLEIGFIMPDELMIRGKLKSVRFVE